ncbi:ribosome small subunit-dependent GTPase A [Fructilactobacillus carniphilus]|uniref:Small ribosomal subunit biogenesis GTPase RsgA n=1 Tax=Fructilactobacillus carniphilus TaxID=2940297 RepID=A0ABY5BY37_9LACO|nr:ribosome small subunit-dependent GTPase A [Fructilactobacillus carniphilus]USS91136.1 ribosome small subunit-dependent GTPase A [Fructilactobacillus carniphilus]
MTDVQKGKIYQSLSGFYDIVLNGKTYRTRARGNFRKHQIKPLVGDWVEFTAPNQQEGYVLKVLPRFNELVRPPIANTDQALVVTSAVEPDFSASLLDKELVALERENIQPILVFTKVDLLSETAKPHFLQIVQNYRQLVGYPTIIATEPTADTQLLSRLTDKQTVVMGQTGAGKSTLLNHLDPELNLATGEISQALSRGKHTTRKVSLVTINGGLVADTPGFSSFETMDIQPTELKNYYPDFVRVAMNCKFRECVHINEPDCAVKQGVKNGTILTSRYEDYVDQYQTIKAQKPVYRRKRGN